MAELAFWGMVGCTVYAYVGYPAVLWVASRLVRRSAPRLAPGLDAGEWPTVSVVVPSYNEARALTDRIANLLALDYPADRLDILIGSDGSTDGTAAVAGAARDPRVRFVAVSRRGGKTALLNALIQASAADIVVFTDANSRFEPDAVARLVARLRDPGVGCVTGELVYTNRRAPSVRHGEGLYWRLENAVKTLEARFGATLVATGAIYALRRSLWSSLPPGISDDAVNPLVALARGYRVIVEPRAIASEPAARTLGEEFRRKSRMVTRQLGAHAYVRFFLRPFRPVLAARLLSHKEMRWFVPFFVLGGVAANLCLLDQPFYRLTAWAGAAGAVAFVLGWLALRRRLPVPGPVRLWVYWWTVNAAAFVGVIDFLRGHQRVIWSISPSTRAER